MNPNERVAYEALVTSGCTVLRNGWPDFLVVRPTGEIFGLEWKEGRDRLAPHQERLHDVFAIAGIPTLVTGSLADLYTFRPKVSLGRRSGALSALRGGGV